MVPRGISLIGHSNPSPTSGLLISCCFTARAVVNDHTAARVEATRYRITSESLPTKNTLESHPLATVKRHLTESEATQVLIARVVLYLLNRLIDFFHFFIKIVTKMVRIQISLRQDGGQNKMAANVTYIRV